MRFALCGGAHWGALNYMCRGGLGVIVAPRLNLCESSWGATITLLFSVGRADMGIKVGLAQPLIKEECSIFGSKDLFTGKTCPGVPGCEFPLGAVVEVL